MITTLLRNYNITTLKINVKGPKNKNDLFTIFLSQCLVLRQQNVAFYILISFGFFINSFASIHPLINKSAFLVA